MAKYRLQRKDLARLSKKFWNELEKEWSCFRRSKPGDSDFVFQWLDFLKWPEDSLMDEKKIKSLLKGIFRTTSVIIYPDFQQQPDAERDYNLLLENGARV